MTATLRISAIFLVITLTTQKTTAVKLYCRVTSYGIGGGAHANVCDVLNYDIFDNDSVTIDGTNPEVKVNGFSIRNALQLRSFPKGVETFIKPCLAVDIENTGLREITQSDFKAFPDLKYLCLSINKIEIIPADLFKFNPAIGVIIIDRNPFKHIDPMVFSELRALTHLYIGKCENGATFKDVYVVDECKKVVKRIESGECSGEILREDGQI